MMNARALLAIAILSLSAPQGASAKCASALYTIKGALVHDLGKPVSGARVLIYLDESTETAKPEEELPISSGTGAFALEVPYDTIKSYSVFFGHNCSRQLRTVTLAVVAQGYEPFRARIDIRRKVRPTGDLDYLVQLGPQLLTRTPSKH